MKITKHPWGSCGMDQVFLFEMEYENGIRAVVSNYGGVLQSLFVRNADGIESDIVLGYDTLAEYQNSNTYFGALIGPIADHVFDGRIEIAGVPVQLPLNAGEDYLHGGPNGFHSRVWDWKIMDNGLELSHVYSSEESGLPGNLQVKVRYLLPQKNTLRIAYTATCDKETAVSFMNHSYFNLEGGKRNCLHERLTVHADIYGETARDEAPISAGSVRDITNTPLDLRNGKTIGDVLQCQDCREIRICGGLDHYFPINGVGMREHVRLESMESGLILHCRSDAPGLLIYSANGLEAELGKNGTVYGKNWGICLETERFPSAANYPHLRDEITLKAGQVYETCTEFEICMLQDG